MRHARGIAVVGLVAAAAAAALSARAISAGTLPVHSTADVTYSCPVQKAKVVDVYAATAARATNNNPASPGALGFNTGIETKTVGGTTTTKAQASVTGQKKNGVTLDKKRCTKLPKRIALSAKQLPVLVTATRTFRGYTSQACDSTKRVVFRLQVHLTGGKPTSAVFFVRNGDSKRKPIAFVQWSPQKFTAHFSRGCTALG
jgi:hypothetical protein